MGFFVFMCYLKEISIVVGKFVTTGGRIFLVELSSDYQRSTVVKGFVLANSLMFFCFTLIIEQGICSRFLFLS